MMRHAWTAEGKCKNGCGWGRLDLGRGIVRYSRGSQWVTASPRRGHAPECQCAGICKHCGTKRDLHRVDGHCPKTSRWGTAAKFPRFLAHTDAELDQLLADYWTARDTFFKEST